MGRNELENLVRLGQLKLEPSAQSEIDTHLQSGRDRLRDACSPDLSLSGRFLLGYSAAYAFSLAALRRQGFRPASRYVVFQCLPHTLAVGPEIWRLLAKAHDVRNGFEYDGSDEVTEDLGSQVIRCAQALERLL
ncbi:hypothetical protein [Herbaspirillum rubrisubalbicans]|uniref:hypothetical protein n=1 Tax=Herbaspirillum rubrisubalbicans TaxID=80842 RepID=UPI0015C55F36|nr:hypothetical protein [Herbaspirillum rubrisubalbicans]NQE47825.1 hypothetical protein [Herbaspirillum rubrisubalbicans]